MPCLSECVWPVAMLGWVMGTRQVERVGFSLGDTVGESRVSDGLAARASLDCLPQLLPARSHAHQTSFCLGMGWSLGLSKTQTRGLMVSIWLLIALNINGLQQKVLGQFVSDGLFSCVLKDTPLPPNNTCFRDTVVLAHCGLCTSPWWCQAKILHGMLVLSLNY